MEGINGDAVPWSSTEIPTHQQEWPPIQDSLATQTTELQERTIRECLPLLLAANQPGSNPYDFDEHGYHLLNKEAHIDFVKDGLEQLPAQFVAMDASRPWLMYWSLMSLYILGKDVKPFKDSIIKTYRPLQNVTGGFGGGQGHSSHLAGTYAAILALAIVGGKEVYNLVNRRALWKWLGQLKQSNGGFQVCEDGEEDTRGAYCAMQAITLLDLPWHLPNDSPARSAGMTDFRDGLGRYLSRCQTFEGGIAASPGGNEAHGAYTFCALACLSILGPPNQTIPKFLDLEKLLQWLSARQYAPEGGFAGRTNKLVDGCYSHWIGGCWPLVEGALQESYELPSAQISPQPRIFSAEALTRYILSCAQAPNGGLRDKPSKRPDAYHTCYNLCGLSMAKHVQRCHSSLTKSTWDTEWTVIKDKEADIDSSSIHNNLSAADVPPFDPVFVLPQACVYNMKQWSRAHPFAC